MKPGGRMTLWVVPRLLVAAGADDP
jgi:hypothetical protein